MVLCMLNRYFIYILCFKGEEIKERNSFLSSFEERGLERPAIFSMIIKEEGVFYKFLGDTRKERQRNLIDDPFANGGVTNTIMDLRESVNVRFTIHNYFDIYPRDEFEPCEKPSCFCGLRGLRRGSYHICPFCKEGVVQIRAHMWSEHQLGFFPTLAELPRPTTTTEIPHPDPLSALVETDHPGFSPVRLIKRKRASSQDGESVGSVDHPPSEEKTTLWGASSPLLPE